MIDMLVWYHLAWMGETVKLTDSRVQHLIAKGSFYTQHDRVELLEIMSEQLPHIIQRYKVLARKGSLV